MAHQRFYKISLLDINQHLSELELIYINAIENDKLLDSKVVDNEKASKSLKELNQKQSEVQNRADGIRGTEKMCLGRVQSLE